MVRDGFVRHDSSGAKQCDLDLGDMVVWVLEKLLYIYMQIDGSLPIAVSEGFELKIN